MDPSSSFQSQILVNANKSEQTKAITCMGCDSYNAAAEGKIMVFKDMIANHQSLDLLLTANKNTVLHIYIAALNSKSKSITPIAGSESTTTINAGSGSTTNFVEKILKMCNSLHIYIKSLNFGSKSPIPIAGSESTTSLNVGSESTTNFVKEILEMCPPLLRQANIKGETPLHIAAKYGHDDIVNVLIENCAQTLPDLEGGFEPVKQMLRMANVEKDTALHEAVRYNHFKVVKLLIEEDPNFSYSANDAGETPLYIAAERGFDDLLFEILDKCTSPMHDGPLGRTALHASIINYHSGITKRILEKIEGISRIADNDGWTPLHFAAYPLFSSNDIAKMLLDKDRDVAYMKDTKGRTALHIAAQRGNDDIMSYIVSRCPDCCELVDNGGWNLLHFAFKIEYQSMFDRIIKIILENWFLSNLLNEKNVDGDTPLHFYSDNYERTAKNFIDHPRLDMKAFNKKNLCARDVARDNFEKFSEEKLSEIRKSRLWNFQPRRVKAYQYDDTTILENWKKNEEEKEREDKERISMLQKASEAHLVVGALITTVTFAACITMPGGFVGSEEGSSHPG